MKSDDGKSLEEAETLGQDSPATPGDPAPVVTLSVVEPGDKIDRYIVLGRIGSGGMGLVYVAFDPELDRKLAIKLLRADRSRHDPEAKKRLVREAQALARVSHPNVIAVHDVGAYTSTRGEKQLEQVFIAMEYVEGKTLRQWLAAERRFPDEIVDVMRQAGRGLQAAHAASVIHRDFKPENVLVPAKGAVRVLDFGLARTAGPSEAKKGELIGTPWYMAPEQMARGVADEASDQFSFCVTLYEAVYGARPFADAASANAARDWTLQPPPTGVRVPGWLRRVLVRGLSIDPAQRFPSMNALLTALTVDPARPRRLLVGALVLAAVAVSGAALVRMDNRRAQLCSGGEKKTQGAWDGGAVKAAFARSKLPFAERAQTAVTTAIEGYLEAWKRQYRDACEATRLRGEQSEELLDLRMRCLDTRLGQVRALGEVLAHADPKVVEKSVQAAEALPPLSDCADAAALTSRRKRPRDAESRARADRIFERLAQAKALYTAGKYPESRAAVTPLVDEVHALADGPLEAEVQLLMSHLEREANEAAKASERAFASLTTAHAAEDDTGVAEAAVALVWVSGYHENKFAEAHRWDQLAAATLVRLGHPPRLEVLRQRTAGLVLRVESKNAEAVAAYQRAIAIGEKIDPEGTDVARDSLGLSTAFQLMDELDQALPPVQRALAIFERRLGAEHPVTANAVETLGNAQFSLGRFPEALEHLQRASTLKDRSYGPQHPWSLLCKVEVADTLLELGRLDETDALLAAALPAMEKALGDKHAMLIYPLQVRAHLQRLRKHTREAVASDERALSIASTALGAEHLAVADSLLALGRDHLAAGQPARALPPLERALKLRESKSKDENPLAQLRLTLAQTLWAAGGDRARALSLASLAEKTFAKASWRKRDHDEAAAWLRARE